MFGWAFAAGPKFASHSAKPERAKLRSPLVYVDADAGERQLFNVLFDGGRR
jgi:hypothetical protein